MSRQVAASLPIPVHRVLALDATTPIAQLVDVLNRFAPDVLHAYASVALRLAEEQATGSLRISPTVITTGSELCTPEMTARIVGAFGVHPTDFYATTEGLWACECERHEGFHVFEDASLVENVDASGRPVPVGEPGSGCSSPTSTIGCSRSSGWRSPMRPSSIPNHAGAGGPSSG